MEDNTKLSGIDRKESLLTEKEVWDVVEFWNYANGMSGGSYGSPVTIDLLNQRLKDISLVNTGDVTEQQVKDALKSPKDNELELLRQSEHFELISQIYKRLLNYLGNTLSFDFTYVCTNLTKDVTTSKRKKAKYLKDRNKVKDFFDSFKYKEEFTKIARQLLRQEAFFSVFRDDTGQFVFQELPSERAKITGKFAYGLAFSFDYNYFLTTGIDIDMYPPIFKENLNKVLTGEINNGGGYNPSNTLLHRGDYGFAQWIDCSASDNFWMFKLTPEVTTRIPFFVGMFPDLVLEPTIRELQKSNYMASAAKIIHGEVPYLNKGKAEQKNSVALTPEILGRFMNLVKLALDNTAVRVASTPLENVKAFDFKADTDIRSSSIRTTIGSSGVSANLLFPADVKPNTIESQLSLAVDEIMMKQIYPQLENFLNFYVNRLTDEFKFKFTLEGTNFYLDGDRRKKEAYDLAERGIVLPQKIAAAHNMNPFDMERQMLEGKILEFMDELDPIKLGSQTTNEDAGRPTKNEGSLSESGAQQREDGGNAEAK